MTIHDLWTKLEPLKEKKDLILKDFKDGITPELPYFVLGQQEVKNKISEYISAIDGNYFNRTFLVSDYGNGKTNILKYLELYFKSHKNIKYIYESANSDKPDIFSMLLELLEFNYKKELLDSIKKLQKDSDFRNEQLENSTFIKEYINRLFDENDSQKIEELIYMGTGRLYNKKIFSDYLIPQLTDSHRKEVLVLFLNFLSKNKIYIIFAIDEFEKIYEKSKARFRNLLTTFRELIDISSQIKGHYFIGAMVTSISHFTFALEENPAFYSRIKKDILPVEFLKHDEEKIELIQNICEMIDKKISRSREIEILTQLNSKFGKDNPLRSNRYMIQETFSILQYNQNKTYKNLDDILKNKELKYEFDDLKLELEVTGVFKRIKDKFIDGLKYYFELKNQTIVQEKDSEYLYHQTKSPIYRYFIFSDNQIKDENGEYTNDIKFINELIKDDKLVKIFYNQEENEIKHDYFEGEVELINFDTKTLLTLFVFLEEELQYQEDIKEIIEHYTKGAL